MIFSYGRGEVKRPGSLLWIGGAGGLEFRNQDNEPGQATIYMWQSIRALAGGKYGETMVSNKNVMFLWREADKQKPALGTPVLLWLVLLVLAREWRPF